MTKQCQSIAPHPKLNQGLKMIEKHIDILNMEDELTIQDTLKKMMPGRNSGKVSLKFGEVSGIRFDEMPDGKPLLKIDPRLEKFYGPIGFLNRISEILKRIYPDQNLEFCAGLFLVKSGEGTAQVNLDLEQIAGEPIKEELMQPLISEFLEACLPQKDYIASKGADLSEDLKCIVREEAQTFLTKEGGKVPTLAFEVEVAGAEVGVVQQAYKKLTLEPKEPEIYEFNGRYDGMSISGGEVTFREDGGRSKKTTLKYNKREMEAEIAKMYFAGVDLWRVQAKRTTIGTAVLFDLLSYEPASSQDERADPFELVS